MENELNYFYMNNKNLTLPNKPKQKKLIRPEKKIKRKETPKNIETKDRLSINNKKSFKKINKYINIQVDKSIEDTTLKKIKERYSQLINRINEDKKDLDKLNKMYDSVVLKTENNRVKTSIDKSKNTNLNSIKRNEKNYINIIKNDNNSMLIFDTNNNYSSKKEKISDFKSVNTKKDNLLKVKIFDKNKFKKFSINKIMPQIKKTDKNNKKDISMNQNNNMSKYLNEKVLLNKTSNNNNISTNGFINKKSKFKKKEKKKNIFTIRNTINYKNIQGKSTVTPIQNLYYKNNEKNYKSNNENDDEKVKVAKSFKMNDLNPYNFHKNKSSSTIYFSPDSFYHNIVNNNKSDNHKSIENYNNLKNENFNDNKNIIYKSKKEYRKENQDKIFETINHIAGVNSNNINNKRNVKNKIKINGNFEPEIRNTKNSLNYLERNSIKFVNPEEDQKIENQFNILNELFNKDYLSKNLTLETTQHYHNPKNFSVKDNNFFNYIVERNIEKKRRFYKKLNVPNNKIKYNHSLNKENNNNKIVKDQLNYLNKNHIESNNIYQLNNNTEIQNNIYYKKRKIGNKSIPKINTMNDLYNKNFFLNNNIESQSTLSSKISYIDFNIFNLSSIKKSDNNNNYANPLIKNRILTSRKQLSNSFNTEYLNNDKFASENKYNNNTNIKNFSICNEKCYYKKKNLSLLKNKEANKKENNKIGRNSGKHSHIVNNHFNSEEYTLDSHFHNNKQNDEYIYCSVNTENSITTANKPYIKPLKINSQYKNRTNNLEESSTNEKLYRKKNTPNCMTVKRIKINTSFNQDNYLFNYFKKPLIKLHKTPENNIVKDIIIYDKNKLNMKENQNNSINKKEKYDHIHNVNIIENSDFQVIEKNYFHCFFKKMYNLNIQIPKKKICFIDKVKRCNKNKKTYCNNKIKYCSSFNTNKFKKKIEFENIKFNGKNIISERKARNNNINKKNKINGCNEFIICESNKSENLFDIQCSESDLNYSVRNNYNNIKQGKDFLIESTSHKNINSLLKNENDFHKKDFYKNYNSHSTSKMPIKFNINQLISKNIKISMAANKLSNLFITKNECENSRKRKSITEEKFELGCSKLNNILHKKTFNCNLDNYHSEESKKNNYDNIFNNKKNNFAKDNENQKNKIINNNNMDLINTLKRSKKAFTYKGKNLTFKNKRKAIKEDKIKDIKARIISILNIMNKNNLNFVTEKLLEILLISNFNQNFEKDVLCVNCIFEKLYDEKSDLSLYIELCKKINSLLTKESKNNIEINKKNKFINIIIKGFYKIIKDREYFNNIAIENEQEVEILEKKFLRLINFISELILNKLIEKEESINLMQNLLIESEIYRNIIKTIYFKGILFLIESLLNIEEFSQINENLIFIIENKLQNSFKHNNISENLKIKINNNIHKINEIKLSERNLHQINNIFLNNEIDNNEISIYKINEEKPNYESKNIFENITNNAKNENKNESYQDENGGNQINFEDDKNFIDVSFKIDNNSNNTNNLDNNNKKKESKIDNIQENNLFSSNETLILINNNLDDSKSKIAINNDNNNNNITKMSSNNNIHKRKSKSKKKSKSNEKNRKYANNEIIVSSNEQNIYSLILKDFDDYFEFLNKKGIKTKNDLYIDINYSYNWKIIDDLIMNKKVKLEEIIKIIIEICKTKKDIYTNDIFKINEYLKTIIEYYSEDLSNNQINIFRLNMIEIYMAIEDIVKDNNNSEIMYEILGNLLFILLKNKMYYIKDLNNFIDKSKETQIKICKIVKYAIIASGSYSKQYINDFKFTKLFNNNELYINYVVNELPDKNNK